jgi:hypothetical protein
MKCYFLQHLRSTDSKQSMQLMFEFLRWIQDKHLGFPWNFIVTKHIIFAFTTFQYFVSTLAFKNETLVTFCTSMQKHSSFTLFCPVSNFTLVLKQYIITDLHVYLLMNYYTSLRSYSTDYDTMVDRQSLLVPAYSSQNQVSYKPWWSMYASFHYAYYRVLFMADNIAWHKNSLSIYMFQHTHTHTHTCTLQLNTDCSNATV